MVETIKNSVVKSNQFNEQMMIPRPHSMVIRFGRAIVVLVETSKRTIQLFEDAMEQIRQFFEQVKEAIKYQLFHYNPGEFNLPQIPKWTFHQPIQRRCKLERLPSENVQLKPILNIATRVLNQLKQKGNSPLSTTKYGAGIPNGLNFCFAASVMQALRVSPSFRKRLESSELKEIPVVQELRKIYDIIEGTSKQPARKLTSTELNHFREICLKSGFKIHKINEGFTQEDTHAFCQFLLSQVGFEEFPSKDHNHHSFPLPANILNPALPKSENSIVLQIADSEVSDIENLVRNRNTVVEVEKKYVAENLAEKGLLTDENIEKLNALKDIELVEVEQTTQLFYENLPRVMPIYLARENYVLETGRISLNTRKINPNQTVDFPLADLPGYSARYEWVSAVTREAPVTKDTSRVINQDSGHYGAWVRYDNNRRPIYMQYNSGQSLLHTTTSPKANESITQNSRLLVYEFRGLVRSN